VFRAFYAAYAGRGDGYTSAQVVDFLTAIDPAAAERLGRRINEPAGLDLEARI
jgi:hypothetical protein